MAESIARNARRQKDKTVNLAKVPADEVRQLFRKLLTDRRTNLRLLRLQRNRWSCNFNCFRDSPRRQRGVGRRCFPAPNDNTPGNVRIETSLFDVHRIGPGDEVGDQVCASRRRIGRLRHVSVNVRHCNLRIGNRRAGLVRHCAVDSANCLGMDTRRE